MTAISFDSSQEIRLKDIVLSPYHFEDRPNKTVLRFMAHFKHRPDVSKPYRFDLPASFVHVYPTDQTLMNEIYRDISEDLARDIQTIQLGDITLHHMGWLCAGEHPVLRGWAYRGKEDEHQKLFSQVVADGDTNIGRYPDDFTADFIDGTVKEVFSKLADEFRKDEQA